MTRILQRRSINIITPFERSGRPVSASCATKRNVVENEANIW